jgi:hypothetical protein
VETAHAREARSMGQGVVWEKVHFVLRDGRTNIIIICTLRKCGFVYVGLAQARPNNGSNVDSFMWGSLRLAPIIYVA